MKKRGFTLVELLAVIVILAVLALITVPMVFGTIESSKRNTFESSAKNTIDAGSLYETDDQTIPPDGLSVKDLDIKNKERYEGLIFVNQKGEYILKNFTNGEYCATGTKDNLLVVKGDCKNTSLEPSVTSFGVTGKTTKSVSVKVEASDDTGIMEYQYCAGSCMKEEDWVTSKENTYTYPNLKYSTEYTLYVRVINRIEKRTEKSVKATTDNLPLPTYAVSPSGWATSKTVKVTYPSGYQYSYMVLEGTVKENGTIVPVGQRRNVSGTSVTLTFESNGRMKAITSDGYNDATAADLIVSQIDTTAPTGVSITKGTVSSKSIQVTANGVDNESGITKYEFSKDNGKTWITNSTKTYTFTNLTSGTYQIKVRLTNQVGLSSEASLSVTTLSIAVPTYAVSPSGWATSKTATIHVTSGYTNQFKVTSGTATYNGTAVTNNTWITISGTSAQVVFTSNGALTTQVSDGINTVAGSSLSINQIDTTAPTGVSVGKGTVTSKSIQVTANGVDNESGITKYEFSKDNGATWITNSTATYTFTNLTTGTYAIKVRLTNGSGLTSEASLSIATTTLTAPTYSTNTSGWTTSKTVTVTYPTGYTNQVKVTSGTATYNGTTLPLNTWYTVSGNAQIVFKTNGTMVAQVTDGVNAKSGSSLTINQIDTTAPVVNRLSIASTTTVYNALTTTITSNVTDNSGATIQMYISNSGYETGGAWENYNSSRSWNVGGSLNGTGRTIYITYRDQAGNKTNRTLSYTVYSNCSSTTTTWSGVWGACSAACGGGTQTMSGTKYDTKTGANCGADSTNQLCNTQSCFDPNNSNDYTNCPNLTTALTDATLSNTILNNDTYVGYIASHAESVACVTSNPALLNKITKSEKARVAMQNSPYIQNNYNNVVNSCSNPTYFTKTNYDNQLVYSTTYNGLDGLYVLNGIANKTYPNGISLRMGSMVNEECITVNQSLKLAQSSYNRDNVVYGTAAWEGCTGSVGSTCHKYYFSGPYYDVDKNNLQAAPYVGFGGLYMFMFPWNNEVTMSYYYGIVCVPK